MATEAQDPQAVEDDAGPLEQTAPVADESPDAASSTAEEAVQQPSEEALLAEFAHFRDLIKEGNYDAADVSAKRIVEMAIRIH